MSWPGANIIKPIFFNILHTRSNKVKVYNKLKFAILFVITLLPQAVAELYKKFPKHPKAAIVFTLTQEQATLTITLKAYTVQYIVACYTCTYFLKCLIASY